MSRTSLRLVWASLRLALLGCLPAAAQQTTFYFHSNFWVNLHHFLYEQAISKSPEPCDSADWQRVLDIYRKDIATHELLSRDNLQGWWPQHNRANLAWIAARDATGSQIRNSDEEGAIGCVPDSLAA